MQALAGFYIDNDRSAEAEKLLAETLEIQRRMLGPEQPDTLVTSIYLGVAIGAPGRFEEAEKLLTETLETCRRVLGPDHWVTFASMYQLACLAALEGDREKALDWLTQAINQGWNDMDRAVRDDDLQFLRGDPAFEALVARARGTEKRN
jgi:hypothetical protein